MHLKGVVQIAYSIHLIHTVNITIQTISRHLKMSRKCVLKWLFNVVLVKSIKTLCNLQLLAVVITYKRMSTEFNFCIYFEEKNCIGENTFLHFTYLYNRYTDIYNRYNTI